MQPEHEYFKLQTPVMSNVVGPVVLAYNRKRTIVTEIGGTLAESLFKELGLKPVGDKMYVMAALVGTDLMINKDTVTREPETVGIDW